MNAIQEQYQRFNQECFAGQLPDIPCSVNSRLRKTLGRCRFQRKGRRIVPIAIEIKKGLSDGVLRKTLLHEMSHVWAMVFHKETGHGAWFWMKMTALGYPKGHILETGEMDRWSTIGEHGILIGDRVYFLYKNQATEGVVLRLNRRSITILNSEGRWRVSAGLLSKTPL